MAKYIPNEADDKGPSNYINEAGRYTFQIESVEDKFQNGHDVTILDIFDTDGGGKMTERLHHTEAAGWRICTFLKACGVKIKRGEDIDIDDSFVGKTFQADVEMRPDANEESKFWPEIKAHVFDPKVSLFSDDAPAKSESKKEDSKW